ncbi:MAG: C25 family cysteine peptidase [candidate division KSB1 bacterium]|nr:C25 family cysteine peptidase [candidate division KSB1 bacterium]
MPRLKPLMTLLCAIACTALILVLWSQTVWAGERSGVQILENSPQRLQFQVSLEGIRAAKALRKSSGAPNNSIPPLAQWTRSFLVILPPDGDVRLEHSVTGLTPVPADSLLSVQLPDRFVRFSEIGIWRGFRLGRMEVNSIARRPDGRLQAITSATVRLQFPPTGNRKSSSLLPEERRFLKLALNAAQAPYWRRSSDRTAGPGERSQAASDPALKIYVSRDGMVRLRVEDLLAAGMPTERLLRQRIRMTNRGEPVPVFFADDGDSLLEAGEAIWFWGERPPGEDAWENEETAANVYWLTLSDNPSPVYQSPPAGNQPAAAVTDSAWQWLHVERNLGYYHGDDDADIFTTDRIPGEGWIWERLFGGSQLEHAFDLPAPAQNAPPGSLRVRVRGITRTSVKPNHHVQVWLNGQRVADTLFSDNAEVLMQTAVPASLFKTGENRIQIKNVGDTGAPIDQIYVDWFEVGFWQRLSMHGGSLRFRARPRSDQWRQQFHIRGIADQPFWIFDLSHGRLLSPDSAWQRADDLWNALFSDTLSAPREYLVITPAGLHPPDSLRLDAPSHWRDHRQQVDMIIVAHADFLPAAQRLAGFKQQHAGLRVAVVNVEDVYDEFNHGIVSVQALRRFFAYAYRQWQPPAPRFVLLIGDGTWDPRRFSPFSRKANFIPVYGNPVSDSRLVCVDGPEDFLPDLFIGRLPVETPAEAEAMVDKIIHYETQPLPDWSKQFVFLNGGINAYEQGLFFQQSEQLIEQFVQPPPVAGRATRIYKTTEGRQRGELLPEILRAIDVGCMLFTFSGHAGSRTWELMMVNEDIPRLQNSGRLPFIASMTCHTARFANPEQNSFGEDFVRLPERGAVAFWSTSGWGFVYQDGILLDGLFQAIARDSVREVGVATTLAKLHLWLQLGSLPVNRNLIDQYTLLGDPSLRLALPTKPDLTVAAGDIAVQPDPPTDRDSLLYVQVRVRNRGLMPVDSVTVRLQGTDAAGHRQMWQSALPPVGWQDSLRVLWPVSSRRGPAQLAVEVDPENRIDEAVESNNRAQRDIAFRRLTLTLAEPFPWAVVPEPQPMLRVYNPATTTPSPRAFVFEVDTTDRFDSPRLMRSPPVAEQPLRTEWQVPLPLPPGVYFWRVRATARDDSLWQSAAFFVDPEQTSPGFRQQAENWHLAEGVFAAFAQGVGLPADSARRVDFRVVSAGTDDGDRCIIEIQGQQVNGAGEGLHLAAYDPIAHSLIGPARWFPAADSSAASAAAAFLKSLPQRAILLAGVRGDAVKLVTPALVLAFREWGSREFEQAQAQSSWAFIGARGRGTAFAEIRRPAGTGEARAEWTFLPFKTAGVAWSPVIGPAARWQRCQWQEGAPQKALAGSKPGTVKISLWGSSRRTGPWKPLLSELPAEQALAAIDPQAYPYVRLCAEFADDDGLDSPVLASWQVLFEPAGDLVLAASQVSVSADSVFPGQPVHFRLPVANFGQQPVDSVQLALQNLSSNTTDAATYFSLQPGDIRMGNLAWAAAQPGIYRLALKLDPDDAFAEPFENNNQAWLTVAVVEDTLAPEIRVQFDGRDAADGEFVAPQPLVVCEIYDDSPLAVQDTADITLKLDGAVIAFADPRWQAQFVTFSDSAKKRAEVRFRPQLSPGEHVLEITVHDRFGYMAEKRVEFVVSDRLALRNVMNYPNPFVKETVFTFELTAPAEQGTIKIFTLAGRLIHTLEFVPQVGFNQIRWDGRDRMGDRLANGVYLYKIVVRRGPQQVEHIQKLAIAR